MTTSQLQLFALDDAHITSTFRGGRDAPLQRWYPFIEGYSPRFVEQVLMRFAPAAKCVFDPFAGTGTTPLTIARMGRAALYAEINPFLRYLIEAKTLALTLPEGE